MDEKRQNQFTDFVKKELILREKILLRLRGYYYHPKLLEYDLRGLFGLEQRRITVSGSAVPSDVETDNISYDLRVRLFKDLPYSAELYALRRRVQTRQTFFNTNEADLIEAGTNIWAREWTIPSRFHYHHYDYVGKGFDTYRETRENVVIDGNRREDFAQYQYSLEFNDVVQGVQKFAFRDYNLWASTFHSLGERREDRWANGVRFRKQSGDISTENSGAWTSYNRKLTESLGSAFDASISDTAIQGATTRTTGASAGLTHKLFQSLTSSVTGRYGATEFTNGQNNTLGVITQFSYRKKTPVGPLSLRYFNDSYVQDESGVAGQITVIDEAQVHLLGTPIFLDNFFIDTSTILVTDVTGTVVYTVDLDYIVVPAGNLTRIDVPVGSLITSGDTILFDYTYASNPGLRFRNRTDTLGGTMTFGDYADVSASWTWVDQKLLTGTDPGILEDSKRVLAGARVYHYGATLGAEYENFESNILPFERLRYHASYEIPLSSRAYWSVGGSYSRTLFPDVQQRERATTASTNFSYTLPRSFSLNLRGEWRDVELRTDKGSGFLLEFDLSKTYRALDVSLIARHAEEDFLVSTDQNISSVILSIRRRF